MAARNAQGPNFAQATRRKYAPPYSASPAPDRQAIVLALEDVVDLEHLGLTRLDPNVLQHRHEALAERFELVPRVPDLTDFDLAV